MLRLFARHLRTRARAVVYEAHGSVEEQVRVVEQTLEGTLKPSQVKVQMLAAPLNPADFNMIEGVYSIRPPLPAIGGNEGVARVLEVGAEAADTFSEGDWVIPAHPGFGTWRTHAVCEAEELLAVSSDIPPEYAATISVNPCTAFRMLSDFVQLKPGDVIVQNGSNSAVGIAVIQLARLMGVHTINIIRDRPDLRHVEASLKEFGADVVVTEERVRSAPWSSEIAALPAPVLGLNCVGGKSSAEIARLLADNARLVTYGGMSRRPVTIPTGKLIFNNVQLHGFWLSRWTAEASREDRQAMLDQLTQHVKTGRLHARIEAFPFSRFQEALARAKAGYRTHKVVLTFDDQERLNAEE